MSVRTISIRPLHGFAALGLAIFVTACSSTGPEMVSLKRPQWECPTPPNVVAEAGTGADPADDYIHLRWIIGDDPDLEGYDIYRRVYPETFDTLYATVPLTPDQLARRGSVIEWTDEGSSVGTLYYYVLFSFSRNGIRSARSDTISYQLLPKPTLYEPKQNQVVNDPRPRFAFAPSRTVMELHTFVVRVMSDSSERSRVVWVSPYLNPTQVTAGDQTAVQYGDGGVIILPTLPPGNYRWRVDAQGSPRVPVEPPCRCLFGPEGCPGTDTGLPMAADISLFGSKSAWRSFKVAP